MSTIEVSLIFVLILALLISVIHIATGEAGDLNHEADISMFCLEKRISRSDLSVCPHPIHLIETTDLLIDLYGNLKGLTDYIK